MSLREFITVATATVGLLSVGVGGVLLVLLAAEWIYTWAESVGHVATAQEMVASLTLFHWVLIFIAAGVWLMAMARVMQDAGCLEA